MSLITAALRAPDSAALPVRNGPWMADVWTFDRPTRIATDGSSRCFVAECELASGPAPGQEAKPTDILCLGHRRRFLKLSPRPELDEFISEQAGSKIQAPRGIQSRMPSYPPVDFRIVHPNLANEIRLSHLVWKAYQRNGIVGSSVTGERLTGAQLHRFRRTVATEFLRAGWSQYEVQKFLGHKSPTMMQAYAEIADEDLARRYEEFVTQSIDPNGARQGVDVPAAASTERLRDRMTRTTLPNGYCTLPDSQTCDFVPTPCLSCTPFFRTTPTFLPVHIRQRDETAQLFDEARDAGRARVAEGLNKKLAQLDRIIAGLQSGVPGEERRLD